MSKRLLNNRIKNLFVELGEEPPNSQQSNDSSLAGWSWEADRRGYYTTVSPEISDFLEYPADHWIGQPLIFCLDPKSILILEQALEETQFPINVVLAYVTPGGATLPTRVQIFPVPWQPDEPFHKEIIHGWRGIVHPAPDTPPAPAQAAVDRTGIQPIIPLGFQTENHHMQPGMEALTDLGRKSLVDNQVISQPADDGRPAVLAVSAPLSNGETNLLLELLDEEPGRKWNDAERMLVEQVANQMTLALENAQLFQQTQNALAATSALYKASAAFSAAQSYADILEALRESASLGNADRILAIHYFNHPWNEPQPPEFCELLSGWTAQSGELTHFQLVLDSGLREAGVISPDKISVIPELPTYPSPPGFLTVFHDEFQVSSLVLIPLVTGGQWHGFISAGYSTEIQLSVEDERHLMALSSQAAIAINNLHLLAETRQRNRELAVINRVVSAVAGSTELHTSLGIIASELGMNLNVQTGIALLNEERQVMTIVASYSPLPDAPDVIGIDLPIAGNASTQQVIATRKLLVIEDAQHNQLTARIHEELKLRSIQSLMLIPLVSGNHVIGTVGLDILEKSRLFTPDEIRLAETIVMQASTAIQNTHLFEQTERALAETETLYKASAEFNEAETYSEVLDILRRYTLVGSETASNLLALFEEPQLMDYGPLTLPERFQPIASWPPESFQFSDPYRPTLQNFPGASELIKPDVPSLIYDIEDDLRFDYQARQIYTQHYAAKSLVFIPLIAGGYWIGFMATFFRQAKALANPDIRRLLVMTNQASVAIQNIRLLEISRRRAEQLQTAAEVARDTSSTLALDALLLRSVNLLCARFGYDHASVFLLDDDGIYAVVREATGEAGAEMKRKPHKLGVGSQSVIGTVTRNGLPLVVNDVSQSTSHRPNPLLPNTRAELGIPLKIGQRVIGALDVQSNAINAFSADDVAVLQVLADQIAVAVDNARAYELSQQAVEDMREVDRLKSQFLANMSHELRTPLNSIIGFSRVILKGIDGPLTDLQEQDLSAIYNSGQHLLSLINDVLDLSKIEAGKLELAFEDKVNLVDMIHSVMSTVIGLVKDKPIQLTRDIAPNLPKVRADPIKIRQVLINLFSNAAKFTEQGTIGINAFEHTGPDNKPEIMIQISDTGPGIAIEHQAKLFQPFSQVDASLTRKTGGSGLGLSICRHLVEMHGGRIGLESQPGAGSTFYFTIPIQIPDTTELDRQDARLILVIDDERPIVQLYERYLSRHGYRVIGLSESHEAVRRAGEVMPYAILLDVMMPGRDGWHVLQDLKANPDTRAIPVIMCTILESQAKGQSLGADGYLTKPILEEELVRTLNGLEAKPYQHTVLGITDNDHEFERFQSVFADEPDYQLGLAFGGHQAISSIHYRKPDVILLAVASTKTRSTHPLNGSGAVSFLETIRNDPKLAAIPVIVLANLPLDPLYGARITELATTVLPKSEWVKETLLERIRQSIRQPSPAS